MTPHDKTLQEVIEKLTSLDQHLSTFPLTTDVYIGSVMIKLACKVFTKYTLLFTAPFLDTHRHVIALHNTLCAGEHEDHTTLNWTSRRQFFIFLKIVAAKLQTCVSSRHKSVDKCLWDINTKEDAAVFNTTLVLSRRYKFDLCEDCSNVRFLSWVTQTLCSLPPVVGSKPFFSRL